MARNFPLKVVWKNILNLFIKGLNILVINATFKLHGREVKRYMFNHFIRRNIKCMVSVSFEIVSFKMEINFSSASICDLVYFFIIIVRVRPCHKIHWNAVSIESLECWGLSISWQRADIKTDRGPTPLTVWKVWKQSSDLISLLLSGWSGYNSVRQL